MEVGSRAKPTTSAAGSLPLPMSRLHYLTLFHPCTPLCFIPSFSLGLFLSLVHTLSPSFRLRLSAYDRSMSKSGLAVGDEIVIEVERAAGDGVCVARHEGQVVFVRDVLPVEQAQVRVTSIGRKGRFVRADLIKVLRESEHRVTPPCNLARECGGCDWQHAELSYQRELKRDILFENLRKFGGFQDLEQIEPTQQRAIDHLVVEPLDDNAGLGYRTRMRFAIDDAGYVGLRAARSHKIIPAVDCMLPVPEISEVVPDQVTNFGDERSLVAATSISLEPAEDSANELHPTALDAAGSNAMQASSVSQSSAKLHAEFGGRDTHRPVAAQVRDRTFEVDLNGFWQVHRSAPDTLVDAVLKFAQIQPGETIFDLYSGVGLFSAFLAEATGLTGAVHAIEGDEDAIEYARQNLDDLPWVTTTCADVADLVHFAEHPQHFVHPAAPDSVWAQETKPHADLVVADPPRAGLGEEVVKSIVSLSPSRVVYVSCDSATFARDVKTFAEHGYHLDQLRAFDLFPMTKHLETVALLLPK